MALTQKIRNIWDGMMNGAKAAGRGIGSAFTTNRLDTIAYSAAAIGVSDALVTKGIENLVEGMQTQPTTTHLIYHASYITMGLADAAMAFAIHRGVSRARQAQQPVRNRWQRFNPPPVPPQPGKASYARSAMLGLAGLAALFMSGKAVADMQERLDRHARNEARIEAYADEHSSTCREETVDGAVYRSLGCHPLRLNYESLNGKDDPVFMVPPADPERGLVISSYGPRKDPVTGEEDAPHDGIDALADNVYAAHDGVVVRVGGSDSTRRVGDKEYTVGGGTCIDIQMYKPESYASDESGEAPYLDVRTRYCCVDPRVDEGERVSAGELIGETTGSCTESTSFRGRPARHLHFMLEMGDGEGYSPVNPMDEAPPATASPPTKAR